MSPTPDERAERWSRWWATHDRVPDGWAIVGFQHLGNSTTRCNGMQILPRGHDDLMVCGACRFEIHDPESECWPLYRPYAGCQADAAGTDDGSDTAALFDALRGYATPGPFDDRLDLLTLPAQIGLLIDLASDHNPSRAFRRTIPVAPGDHDVVIPMVLRKLVTRIAQLDGTPVPEPKRQAHGDAG